ncbi:MAG: M42 family metallopeptidase [bacterium]
MNLKKEKLSKMKEYIVDLCEIPSPSGFTKKVENYLLNKFRKFDYNPDLTHKGSVVVDLGGSGKPLVLAAHIDTLGAMVRSIKDNGRIRFTKIGGYPANNIEQENCLVHTRDGKEYSATIQLCKPSTHVYNDINEIKRDDESLEIVLDEIVNSKDDVKDLGIKSGDFISFYPRTVITKSGYIKSRHLDDKASAGILLELARMIKEKDLNLNRKVYLVFTSYEEVGHGGASGIPEDIIEMISVDMGAVGDDLETDERKVSICAKDSGGPYDYDLTTKLINVAESNKLNYAVDIYPYYGSDVDVTLRSGFDIKHGLIGPGVFASHGYERTHEEGLKNTLELLLNYLINN